MGAIKKIVNVIIIYSTLAILSGQICSAEECNLGDIPGNFSLLATASKKNKIRSVSAFNRKYEIVQNQIAFEALPDGMKKCFLSLKQTSRQKDYEVGGIIALFDNSEPVFQPMTSNQKRTITGIDIQKTFDAILANANREHIKKIILVHTHPAGSDSISFHSPGDAQVARYTEEQFSEKLGRNILVESAVLPLHDPFEMQFVVGVIAEVIDLDH